jgi:Ca-activated chloride channel family protein
VLLSDGEANVGEKRPAVLAEIAAGAAPKGLTTSTLGVGFDYNIALLNAVAESGNGDFSHIATLATLDEVLRGEFTTAADVMARCRPWRRWRPCWPTRRATSRLPVVAWRRAGWP